MYKEIDRQAGGWRKKKGEGLKCVSLKSVSLRAEGYAEEQEWKLGLFESVNWD